MDELRLLFAEAVELTKKPKKPAESLSKEQFSLCENKLTNCIQKLIACENIVEREGKLNYAKMDLAKFILSSGLSEPEAEALILKFAENWHTDRHPHR